MKLGEVFRDFLQSNCWIDERGNLFSQWKEHIAFEMSDEMRKIVTKLYFEPSDKLMPPKPSFSQKESKLPPRGVNLSDCGSDQKELKK